ncbi:hypothetical protein QJQ45_018504 [Haematococcus lacustris]|nr:hypothetical protein QJQ45_018504 [Haematococcus lacustris]
MRLWPVCCHALHATHAKTMHQLRHYRWTSSMGCVEAGLRVLAPPKLSRRARLEPRWRPRVTNTCDEVYRSVGEAIDDGETPQDLEISDMQVHNPELGRLEGRIGKFYLEELFNDTGVDLEETAYWFHTPPGGWNTKPRLVKPAREAPVTFPQPEHLDARKQGRVGIADLYEGQQLQGVITDCWLYHGIQVDFGAAYDGLVPMTEDEWMEEGVQGALMPGQEIVARIYKLRQPGLFRWPVQLELLMPQAVAARLTPPEEYMPPINHAWASDQGWQIEDICQAAGRPFHAAEYYLNTDDEQSMEDMQLAYGFDDPEESRLPLTQDLQDKLDERAVMQTQNAVSSMF